jgi:putative peptidoglycan lipid II flippase
MNRNETILGRAARSTGLVMGLLALAKVVGLVRQQIVARQFGTGAEYDAYQAALAAPELLTTLLAYSTLGIAFIPIFTGLLTQGRPERANRLASSVLNNVLLVVAVVALGMAAAAPVVVSAPWGVGPGFAPETQALTVRLLRVALIAAAIFSLSGIFSSMLHAHQHFFTPALAPIVYDLGVIMGALALAPRMGIMGLAWGVVVGALLHAGVQIPALVRQGVRWSPALGWTDPELGRVLTLMAPRVVDLLMARLSIQWINANLASRLMEGSVSAIGYAYQLMNMPETIIGTAIGFVFLPTLSTFVAQEDIDAQRRALSGALRAILALTLPAAVGLLVFGRPVIQVLFQRGEFTAESTEMVYWALQFYALGLITHSMLEVAVRAFAARQDTLTPLVVSFFTTALNIGLAAWLIGPLAHGGLALANSAAVGVEVLADLTILHIRWKGIHARRVGIDALKAALAAGVMGVAVIGFQRLLSPGTLVFVLVGGVLGVAIYFALALALGIREMRTIPVALMRSLLPHRSAGGGAE